MEGNELRSIQFTGSESEPHENDYAELYILLGGRIDTDNDKTVAVITSDNELLAAPSFNYGESGYVDPEENLIFSPNYYSHQPLNLNGTTFSLLSGGGSSKNYYHWLYDSLSRLHILRSLGYDLNEIDHFIIPGPFQSYKTIALRVLGLPEEKIINSKERRHIIAEKLVITSHPNDPYSPMPLWIPQFLQDLFREFREESNIKNRVFVSRSRAQTRRLLNESEIFAALEKLNFKKVFLEDLSFDQQVSLFANTETIVSPHGAGLANLVFCSPKTKVIELFPNNSEAPIYSDLANLVGLNYTKINEFQELTDLKQPDLHTDFYIDLSLLIKQLESNSPQIQFN